MWIIKRLQWFALIIALTIFLFSFDYVEGVKAWSPNENFETMGITIAAYFSPEPGNVSIHLQKINGIIEINRNSNDYNLKVLIMAYGTIQGNETVFSNTAWREIFIDTTINSYTEKVSLETPSNGIFITYMVVDFIWYYGETRLDNTTIYLAADYQKVDYGFDLASIVIPGGFIILCAAVIILISYIGKKSRQKPQDAGSFTERLEIINQTTKTHFSRGGEFKELELSRITSSPKPGEISLLMQRKKKLQKMLKKLKPKFEEMDIIATRLEEAREPVVNNHLFKLISSFFMRASRKRENYPQSDDIVEKVQQIRSSLQDGRWDEFQNEENIRIAWQICDKYINTLPFSKDLPFDINFDINREITELNKNIKEYNRIKKATIFPPDREIIIKTKEDILAEIEIIDVLLEKFKPYCKKNSKNYVNQCSNLKKEANQNLKWLESNRDDIDDTNFINLLTNRLQKLDKLMDNEIELTKKLKSSSL